MSSSRQSNLPPIKNSSVPKVKTAKAQLTQRFRASNPQRADGGTNNSKLYQRIKNNELELTSHDEDNRDTYGNIFYSTRRKKKPEDDTRFIMKMMSSAPRLPPPFKIMS